MVDTDWADGWHDAFRIELRAQAIGLAWRGWPVLPGTYPTRASDADTASAASNSVQHGALAEAARSGRSTSGAVNSSWCYPEPVHADWHDRIGAHPQRIAAWWTGHPYSLLVATGTVLDAVEVDDELGRHAARLLRATGQPAPIVAVPNGHWLFLTTAGVALPRELSSNDSVRRHGEASWIPLPPTPFQQGIVHWRVKPDVWGWRLPRAQTVHEILARAQSGEQAPSAAGVAQRMCRRPEWSERLPHKTHRPRR